MKLIVIDMPPQQVMTKDYVSVGIDSVLCYRVENPYLAAFLVENLPLSVSEQTQTALRTIVGSRTLQECIENRESFGREIQTLIDPIASRWGVHIESVQIKDLQLPKDLMESLSAIAKEQRLAESKLIAAGAEVTSAKLLSDAAKILDSPVALKIRYFDTIQKMANSCSNTVIFLSSK